MINRIKFYFICCLVTLNGLFIGYALGLNSRHVLIVDPKLPHYVKPAPAKAAKEVVKVKDATSDLGKSAPKEATSASQKPPGKDAHPVTREKSVKGATSTKSLKATKDSVSGKKTVAVSKDASKDSASAHPAPKSKPAAH